MIIIKKQMFMDSGKFIKNAKIGLFSILIISLTNCYEATQKIPLPKPQSNFYFSNDTFYVAPCEVFFQNQSYYATEFEWNFEDGRIYSEINVTHYFNDAGVFNITLKAINADGEATSITKSIEILESAVIPTKHMYDGKWNVSDPYLSTFISFEFSNNRYVAQLSNNVLNYGKLHYSDNTFHLSNFGNVYVQSYTNNEMKLVIDGVTYNLLRENPIIPITDATLKLTNGCWVHAIGTEATMPNDEWMFTTAGTFVSWVSGTTAFFNWSYLNDSTLVLTTSQNETMNIEQLTLTRLVMKNNLEQTYKLNTVVYK